MSTSWLQVQTMLLDVARGMVGFAVNWSLQSTILIVAGMVMARLLRQRGSAVQSAIYRTTLVAVLLCPLASGLLWLGGVSGWSIEMPAAWTYTVLAEVPPSATEPVTTLDRAEPQPISTSENSILAAPNFPLERSQHSSNAQSMPPVAAVPTLPAITPAAPAQGAPHLPATQSFPAKMARFEIYVFAMVATVLCFFWSAIASILLLRLALAWSQLARLRLCAITPEASTIETCQELAARLQIAAPEVLRSPYFPSPCLTGIYRPAILLPDASMKLPIRDVLAHELAHLRRLDCHWNLLWRLATAVFFFQPLLWQLARRMEATAEEVCDDYVVQLGGNRQDYAHQLVDIAEQSSAPLVLTGVGIVSLRTMLATRVVRIMDTSRSLSTRAGKLFIALVLVAGLVGTFAVGFVGAGSQASTVADQAKGAPPGTVAETAGKPDTPAAKETPLVQPQADSSGKDKAPLAGAEKGDATLASDRRGRVFGADGKPVAGAKLYWFRTRFRDLNPMQPRVIATTNDAGEFRLATPAKSIVDPNEPAGWEYREYLVVTAPGHGFVYTSPDELRREIEPPKNALGAFFFAIAGGSRLTISMPSAGESIRGQLVDIDGQPVVGATVRIRWFEEIEGRGAWQANMTAADEKTALQEQVNQLVQTIEPEPFRYVLPMATTDAAGRFELRDIGAKRMVQLLVQGERIESTEVVVRNQSGDSIEVSDRWSKEITRTLYPKELLRAVGPSKPVVGRVIDHDTGNPIADAIVRAFEIHGINLRSSREREEFATRTDPDGRYRITGLPIGAENYLVAFTVGDIAYLPSGHQVDTSKKGDPVEREFRLKRGVWAEGRVFDTETDKPFVGQINYYHFRDRALEKEIPGLFRAFVDERYWTNSKGEFRVPVLPIRGILAFSYSGDNRDQDGIDRFARGAGAAEIKGSEDTGGLGSFPTLPSYLLPSNYERVVQVHPAAGATTVRVDMPLTASTPVTIRVVDASGKPVVGYAAYGANDRWGWQDNDNSEFQIEDLRLKERRKVFVFHRERNLAGGAIINQGAKEPIEIKLVASGSISGRIVDGNGDPITDVTLDADYEKLQDDDTAAIWADGVDLIVNPSNIPVDKRGRFVLEGLIPGWTYNADASAPRKYQGKVQDQIIASPITGVKIKPGEKKDLGDLIIREGEPDSLDAAKADEAAKAAEPQANQIRGVITDMDGRPVIGAHVAAVGRRLQPGRGGDLDAGGEVLAEATTNPDGTYRLTLHKDISSKTHQSANLIARTDGAALTWQVLNLDAPPKEASFQLAPEEPIRARLVDIEGQPAENVKVQITAIMRRPSIDSPRAGTGYRGDRIPNAWFPPMVSDKQGYFAIRGVAAGFGAHLRVEGSDRFAPQDIALNTGASEQRGERDATYRPLVKNFKPGEEAVLPLAPAQLFEGVIRYEDTREVAPHAELTIWASQQEHGSMYLVAGKADAQGRYRFSAYPGIRFGVTAYPPAVAAYLIRKTVEPIRWEAGDRVKQVDLTLPRGVLVRGMVTDAKTSAPLSGVSLQYIPEEANNPRASDTIITGSQGSQLSGQDGKFQIAVLPGPGWLVAQATGGSYILQEAGSSQLSFGTKGGQRYYAHAFFKIDPRPDVDSIDVKIELQPGVVLAGRMVDEQKKPVDEALVISRLGISAHSLWWRGNTPPVLGGRFELAGLKEGVEYPTYFLDAKRRLGATANFKVSDTEPTVVLQPCATANVRFVDSKGEPVTDYIPIVEMVVTPGPYRFDIPAMQAGNLVADSDFIGNIDRINHGKWHKSDLQGKLSLPALIPGATYHIIIPRKGRREIAKEFQPKANESLELGDLTVEPKA